MWWMGTALRGDVVVDGCNLTERHCGGWVQPYEETLWWMGATLRGDVVVDGC